LTALHFQTNISAQERGEYLAK